MDGFILSGASTADISKEHFNSLDIRYICYHFTIDGRDYPDDLGESLPYHEFYTRMAEGALTTTAQINIEEYIEYFDSLLAAGRDLLHICFSSGLSGSYGNACRAARIVGEKYPERKIYIVDSLCACSGYGLLLDTLAKLRDEGKTIDELRDWAENNKLRMNHWGFSTDLKYVVRGGRVSKTIAFVGNLLSICPLFDLDNSGKIKLCAKVRTKRRAVTEMIRLMEENAENRLDYSGKCYIAHSDCLRDAEQIAALIAEKFKKLDGKPLINNIGTTIGSHTGPGTITIFYWGSKRVD